MRIIISTHQRTKLLDRTLESISCAVLPRCLEAIMVVENGIKAGTEEICNKYKGRLPVEYYFIKRSGRARAIQYAMEKQKKGFSVILDDDVRLSKNILCEYMRAAEKYGPGHFFGGPVKVDFVSPPDEKLMKYMPTSVTGIALSENVSDPGPDFYFLGFNMAVFIEDVLNAGGIDANYGPGAFERGVASNPTGSEYVLQQRLRENKCKPIYLHSALLWHFVPPSECSLEWLLHRSYRQAIYAALISSRYNYFFIVIAMLRFFLPSWLSCLLSRAIPNASKERLYLMRRRFFWLRGILKGVQLKNSIRKN